jgi:hypothetical protein
MRSGRLTIRKRRQQKLIVTAHAPPHELLSNLVFEGFGSCGDLAWFGGFNSVFECDASDDFGKVVKAA